MVEASNEDITLSHFPKQLIWKLRLTLSHGWRSFLLQFILCIPRLHWSALWLREVVEKLFSCFTIIQFSACPMWTMLPSVLFSFLCTTCSCFHNWYSFLSCTYHVCFVCCNSMYSSLSRNIPFIVGFCLEGFMKLVDSLCAGGTYHLDFSWILNITSYILVPFLFDFKHHFIHPCTFSVWL